VTRQSTARPTVAVSFSCKPSARILEIEMADMDVDTPAPSKKDGKDDGKQRFEVKKV